VELAKRRALDFANPGPSGRYPASRAVNLSRAIAGRILNKRGPITVCRRVVGDNYAGEFPRELFRKHGIIYEICKTPKSDLFHDLLPLFNSGRFTLPRNDRLVAQIVGLEVASPAPARTHRSCA
jgi:hypothetical protein